MFFFCYTVIYARKHNGNQLAILNGYTFSIQYKYKNTVYWQCTMGSAKCKARLVTTDSGDLRTANMEHTHPSPKYTIVNGIFVKI